MARIQLLEGFYEATNRKVRRDAASLQANKLIVFSNRTTLRSFLFQTVYRGEQLKQWSERSIMLQRWRRVLDRYPTFNASAFHGKQPADRSARRARRDGKMFARNSNTTRNR